MTKRILLIISACAILLQTGCIQTSGNLSARVDQHEQQINHLLTQLGQVEQVLPGQAETWSRVQTMEQEIAEMRGKLSDVQGTKAEDSIAGMRERLAKLESAVTQMAAQLGVAVEPSAGGKTSAAASGAAATTPSKETADSLYNKGIKSFDQKRYKDAVVHFKDFVAAYPSNKLASNAHFWQGEAYYQMKDYARAALAYQEVIAKHAGSAKVQSSMLKQGMALYYVGKKDAGLARLKELVSRYPNSPETTRAKQFLEKNSA